MGSRFHCPHYSVSTGPRKVAWLVQQIFEDPALISRVFVVAEAFRVDLVFRNRCVGGILKVGRIEFRASPSFLVCVAIADLDDLYTPPLSALVNRNKNNREDAVLFLAQTELNNVHHKAINKRHQT